jgi:PucR family transcriptional regulator, purine catabolism regulatory protein
MSGTAGHRAAALGAELDVLRARGLLASTSVADAGSRVALHPLGASGRVRGFLAVGTPTPLDRTAQSVVAVAVSLLSIAVEQAGGGEASLAVLRSAAVRLLVAGSPLDVLPVEPLDLVWLATAPLRLVVATAAAGEVDAAAASVEAALLPTDLVLARTEEELLVLVPDRPDVLAALGSALGGVRAGGSAPTDAAGVPAAHRQAMQALAAAHSPRLSWYGELAAQGMLAALDPEAAGGVADALLSPLEGRKGDLLTSLAAWLARHGQWDAAAVDLGVHRHTLRYRMRRVEEILGRSLDDADLRAELWLALRVRAAAGED